MKRIRLYSTISFVITTILLIFLLTRCSPVIYPKESFFYEEPEIYHVSIYGDTTQLNFSDVKILQIDSLKSKYLELKAER